MTDWLLALVPQYGLWLMAGGAAMVIFGMWLRHAMTAQGE